jgi:hypothetical protein
MSYNMTGLDYYASSTPQVPTVGPPDPAGKPAYLAVNWASLHSQSRVHATPTSFGWAPKLVLCFPPWLVVAYLTYGGLFKSPLLALVWGLPLVVGSLWWTTQMWNKGTRGSARYGIGKSWTSKLPPTRSRG